MMKKNERSIAVAARGGAWRFGLCLSLLTTAAPVLAQIKDPALDPAQQFQSAIDHDQVFYDVSADGSVWALGASYKARFGIDGAMYVPNLGGSAPKNYPLTLRVTGIRAGGQLLNFAAGAEPVRTGDQVAYDRGVMTELYDLKPGSVEQSFVFQVLPRGGDLRIQIAMQSDLARTQAADGFKFANDRGSVSYSKAVVMDGAGRSAAAQTVAVEGGLEIRVPASFLATAAFPVTVDPILSTSTIYSSDLLNRTPDVAFDVTNGVYLAVWEHNFSDTDGDIYSQFLDIDGNPIAGTQISIDFTTDNWRNPSVANNNISDQFLAVAQVDFSPFRVIKGRTRDAASIVMGPQFQISAAADGGDKLNAHVGGDPNLNPPTYYCVVWQRNFGPGDDDIHARLVRTDSSLVGATTIPVDNTTGTLDRFPNISKSDGAPPAVTQEWNIVWQRQFSAGDEDIRGAQIHWNGVITEPSFVVDSSTSNDESPAVSSLVDNGFPTRDYMVAYQRGPSSPRQIHARIYNGSNLVTGANLTAMEGVDMGEDHARPSVDCGGVKFVVAYAQSFSGSSLDYDIWASTFCIDSAVLETSEIHRALAYSNGHEDQVQIAAQHSGGGPSNHYAAVWHNLGLFSSDGFIQDGIYQAPGGCCVADITGNGVVNVDDLLSVINHWGPCFNCAADINGSTAVDVDDLLIVINGWGPCP